MSDTELRQDIVAACRKLEADGLNRGSAGNVSVRSGDAMLITPSAVGYDALEPGMLARMQIVGDASWEGPKKPSSEWRFHRDLLAARPDINAIVHTHAPWCTVLAIARREIPAVHYMIAAFGGPTIRLADYARYGTQELSDHVIKAMDGRLGCLMANHGMLVGGPNLARAMWLAGELEALAHQHYHTLAIGGGHVLTDAQIEETAQAFSGYGLAAEG